MINSSEILAMDKNLYGLLTKCQNCPYISKINEVLSHSIKVECHMCGVVSIQIEDSSSSKCKNEELKTICQNFYVF